MARPLGHIPDAELVPLGTLATKCKQWDRDQPLVIVCRSSGRSDAAARGLERSGFKRVASMVGGMLAWREQKLEASA